MSYANKVKFFSVLLVIVFVTAVAATGKRLDGSRSKRGAAYAGGYGDFSGVAKLTPSVALGTFGGHVINQRHGGGGGGKQTVQEALGTYGGHVINQRHGGGGGKQTVQEALGTYGGFLQGGHQGPVVIGNDGGVFNKH